MDTTKLAQMRALWVAGDRRGALRMTAGWARLGPHKTAIQQAWQATQTPDFYREIGKDPDELIAAGYRAMIERYKLPSDGE